MTNEQQPSYHYDPSSRLSDNISLPEDIFLRYRFGIDDGIIRGLVETAELFEMTTSDAIHLEKAAIDKLSPTEKKKLYADDRIPSWQI
jgi:hypothetical protein